MDWNISEWGKSRRRGIGSGQICNDIKNSRAGSFKSELSKISELLQFIAEKCDFLYMYFFPLQLQLLWFLFKGHPGLIVRFNTFLPPGFKIEVPIQ